MLSEDCGNCHTSIFCPLVYAVPLCKLSNNSFFQPQRLPATKLICTKQIFWSSLLTNLSRTDIDFHKKSSLWQTLTLFAHLYWGAGQGGKVWGASRQSRSGGPSLLYIPLLVFWPVFSLGGKEAQAGKMLKTCKHKKFLTGFAKFL